MKSMKQIFHQSRKSGVINLSSRELLEFPIEICYLNDNLESDEKFWECVDLSKVDLSHNMISSLPKDVQMLQSLHVFKLSYNNVCALRQEIFEMSTLVTLDMSNNNLSGDIPNELGSLVNLKELNFSFNQITALPESIRTLQKIEILYVQSNKMKKLTESIGYLQHLRKLSLSSNELTSLPCSIGKLKRLQELLVDKNKLMSLPNELTELESIVSLDFRQNNLTLFPELPFNSHLDRIFLGYNKLTSIPEEALLRVTNSLTVLDIRDNQIPNLPESVCHLVLLKTLDLSNNELNELLPGLGYLKKLDRIHVDGNPLRSVRRSILSSGNEALKKYLRTRGNPPGGIDVMDAEYDQRDTHNACSIFDFTYLIRDATSTGELQLSGRNISKIPKEVTKAINLIDTLVSINLSDNQFINLDETLASYASLKKLVANKNKIEDVSPQILLMENLCHLELQKNQISSACFRSFLSQIATSNSLKVLDLRNNNLTSIPSSIINLSSLQTLILAYNGIESLDNVLWKRMHKLEFLSASNNKLNSLGTVHEAPILTSLDVENNDIRKVPIELGFSNLRSFCIMGNPQRTVRSSTIAKGTEAILSYLRSRKLPDHVESEKGDYVSSLSENNEVHNVSHTPGNNTSSNDILEKLDSEIRMLELELDNVSLSQAKRYAIKKTLAKTRSVKIREERKKLSK